MTLVTLYGRVLRQLGPDQRTGWGLAVTNVCLAIALFAEPILFGRVIDTLSKSAAQSTGQLWDRVVPLLLAWAGFGLFTITAGASIALLSDRLAHRRRHAVLADYFEHVLLLPLSQHSRTHSGRAMKVMVQGTDTLWWLWLSFFRDNLAALVSLIVLIPVALYINWRLAWVLIVLCVIFALLTHFILNRTQLLQGQVESHHSDLAERASDTLGNVALVQSFARVKHEVESLKGISQRVLSAQLPVLSWWAVMTMLTRSATTLTILCIVVLGAWLFTLDLISVGEIVTFIALASLVIGKLEQVVSFINRLAMDAPKLRDFFEVLDTHPLIHDTADAVDPGRLTGKIAFKDVSFSYDGKRIAIDNLSFTIQPGQTIALVGASGAGKTTALSLLYRAFDPQTGVITVDDQDIRHYQLTALRRNIGVVFQEPLLFNRSIAENLRIGSPDATDAQLLQACARAQALEFIERQPQGLETNIGERGRALSGGERQRLSIARVILKDPPILILDEATSALDGTTELKLMEALEEVTRNRTTLVIAHRLSTIRHADVIMVMEGGRVLETGSFDTLYARHGRFTEIVNAQFNENKSKSPE
jgi:ATP-binding cassette, subfamily B, beta-glucan exporter